jgi:hypothetical protein
VIFESHKAPLRSLNSRGQATANAAGGRELKAGLGLSTVLIWEHVAYAPLLPLSQRVRWDISKLFAVASNDCPRACKLDNADFN